MNLGFWGFGVDGNLIQAHKRNHASIDYGFVGDIDTVNTHLLLQLLSTNTKLVVAPITHDGKGQLLNTNADTVAQILATALASKYNVHLMYGFEKEGVLKDINDPSSVIAHIDRVFAPIIVRGEENEGVRLWQFGKEVYQSFLNLASDEEIGDYTEPSGGRDIKLTTVGPEVTGTPYNKTTLSPSLKISSISDDAALVSKLLENQPNPKEIFKKLTFDEVKANLQTFLQPEDENEEGITSELPVAFDGESKNNYSLGGKDITSKSDKFDSLFDSKDTKSEEDSDDLPF